jgi:hypothetical protein
MYRRNRRPGFVMASCRAHAARALMGAVPVTGLTAGVPNQSQAAPVAVNPAVLAAVPHPMARHPLVAMAAAHPPPLPPYPVISGPAPVAADPNVLRIGGRPGILDLLGRRRCLAHNHRRGGFFVVLHGRRRLLRRRRSRRGRGRCGRGRCGRGRRGRGRCRLRWR